MADFKTLVSDVIDLTDTAEYFEFDTQGFTTISLGVEYSTGTPSACYVKLL